MSALTIILAYFGQAGTISVPSAVRVVTYQDPSVVSKITHTYSDGIGRKVQVREEYLGDDIVTSYVYDPYGRLVKTSKPFMNTNLHAFLGGDNFALASAYYNGSSKERPNAGGKAFSEDVYYKDPRGLPSAHGEPGASFSATSHPIKVWYLGRATPDAINPPLSDALLDNFTEAGAIYHLMVSKDANGNYRQQVSDIFGNVLKTWSDPTTAAGDEIVASNQYDAVGNPFLSLAPGPGGAPDNNMPTTRNFLTTGELTTIYSPDQGYVDNIYDKDGKLRFYRTSTDVAEGVNGQKFHYIKYDAFGREVEIGFFSASGGNPWFFADAYAADQNFPDPAQYAVYTMVKKYYDNSNSLAAELSTTPAVLGTLKNLKGRLVAESIHNQWSGNLVIDLYSYDTDGRVAINYKYLPNIPVQALKYTYNLQGNVTTKIIESSDGNGLVSSTSTWAYNYLNGRLSTILKDGKVLVTYIQNPVGELATKKFTKNGVSSGSESFTYNVRNWPSRIEAYNAANSQLYRQELYYESGTTTAPKFNGDLVKAVHVYKTPAETEILDYGYDQTDRLIGTGNATGNYNEVFNYDAAGRILKKTEGSTTFGPYHYLPDKNEVSYISGSPTKGNSFGNYVYDANGNMIIDRSKKMSVIYDFRNMPVDFQFFDAVPNRALTEADVYSMGGANKKAEVYIDYDAEGNRVSKQTYRY